MKLKNTFSNLIVPPHYKKLNPKQKRFIKIGCALLAVMLTVGTVPLLMSRAAERDAVTPSDVVTKSDVEAPADEEIVTLTRSVEPQRYNEAIGGMDWIRMTSLDELSDAALSSKSTIDATVITNWIDSYLDEFMEANGYTDADASNLWFVNNYDGSMLNGTKRGTLGYGASPGSYPGTPIFYYLPRSPHNYFTVSHEHVNINVGEEFQFSSELGPDTTNDRVVWSSSDANVAAINSRTGLMTGVGYGEVVITATAYDETKQITVNVSGGPTVSSFNTSQWVKAESWDDLKNASFIDRKYLSPTFLLRSKIDGKVAASLYLVNNYNAASETASYIQLKDTGAITEETFDSFTDVYYIPRASVHTFHPAEPANCVHLATIDYWEDQDGNVSLDAKGEQPIDSIYDPQSTLADHDWNDWEVTTPATCAEKGEETRVCKNDASHTKTREVAIDANAHDWGDWEVTTPATCTAAGEETRVCRNDPSHTETREVAIDANAHDFGDWEVTTPATCTSAGEETRVCRNDPSHTETREIAIDANAHDWNDWEVTTPATCEGKGEKTRVCKNDPNHKETEEIPALGHDWGDWEVTTPATCEGKGEQTRTCQNDPSHKETREIPALGHGWSEWTETKAATCAAVGEETRVCQNDPSHTETREVAIDANAHDWGDWEITKKPTATEPGEKKRTCQNDPSHTETQAIPAIGSAKFEPIDGDGSQYQKGSDHPVTMRIDRTDADDENVYQYFLDGGSKAVVKGKGYEHTLTSDEFDASSGSLIITLKASYLSTLSPGEYTLTATFSIYGNIIESEPVTFTVAKSSGGSTDSPGTGENGMIIALSCLLLVISAAGAAYAVFRKKKSPR